MLIFGLITKTFKFLIFLRGLLANKFFCVYLHPQVEAPYPHTPKNGRDGRFILAHLPIKGQTGFDSG